ncbi:MAG: crosslink repair DNA glycosylase YcaQ family protein [Myxococcota bacterium]
MESLSVKEARRLALARAGLLKPDWSGFPSPRRRVSKQSRDAHDLAYAIVEAFGYLQLDTISVSGARSHAIVLLSRLENFSRHTAEELLRPGASLFEYWGHEASWMPMSLYPAFAFRRRRFRDHPWSREILSNHPKVRTDLLRRIRADGPLRSVDMEGEGGKGWWNHKVMKRVANAMWSTGELAIRERRKFQRTYDLAERVIPRRTRQGTMETPAALRELLLRALVGHGWATTRTLSATWRLRNLRLEIQHALRGLVDAGEIVPCELVSADGESQAGWVRPGDLDLAARLRRVRPRRDRGVLLSPFDPVLWDRKRVAELFAFDQKLEAFTPASKRIYGYFCMPVLAGEELVARVDLKAERKHGQLAVVRVIYESASPSSDEKRAVMAALRRYADALELALPTRFRD